MMRILAALALIAVIAVAASAVYYFSYTLPRMREAEIAAERKRQDSTRALSLAQKCRSDGMRFFENRKEDRDTELTVWDDPEFHFNKSLNTCLVDFGYRFRLKSGGELEDEWIWDIYSNRSIADSHARTDEAGKVIGDGQLRVDSFLAKKTKLFAE
jgi:hypothetical protein